MVIERNIVVESSNDDQGSGGDGDGDQQDSGDQNGNSPMTGDTNDQQDGGGMSSQGQGETSESDSNDGQVLMSHLKVVNKLWSINENPTGGGGQYEPLSDHPKEDVGQHASRNNKSSWMVKSRRKS